ncbi:unnamed protein product [Thelazia callipaeda]|uniref:RGS domain-containing protein n=1 Tax=Thelazia callipaeda TaxID=103827 RepID=A0A158RCU5_THECL|nr:unnamed protein product [Thelazia callipaeda]
MLLKQMLSDQMDLLATIEDPRHTPGKEHDYAREQLLPGQAFHKNRKQPSLLSNFIITPPVAKPSITKYLFIKLILFIILRLLLYLVHSREQKLDRDRIVAPIFWPSSKSAFKSYQSLSSEKLSQVRTDPPQITSEVQIPREGILKPKPRHVVSNNNIGTCTKVLYSPQQSISNNKHKAEADVSISELNNTIQKQEMAYSESKIRRVKFIKDSSPRPPIEKGLDDPLRLKKFKSILSRFQMASDHVLRQQEERERRMRYGTSGYESDQGCYAEHFDQTAEFAYFEQDYRVKKNKPRHLQALTISIPAVRRGTRHSLPKQWSTQVNTTHIGTDVESPSPTMSGISSIPPSPPISSATSISQKPPNMFEVMSPTLISADSKKNETYFDLGNEKQQPFRSTALQRYESALGQRRCTRSISRPRPVFEHEEARNCDDTSQCSHVMQFASTKSYNKLKLSMQTPSHSPQLPPSEPRSPSTAISEDDSSLIANLYKQMTGNHFELLEYASLHLSKFFRNGNLTISKSILQRLKLNDLVFESPSPVFTKYSTYFFNAFIPHDNFLTSAVSVMAEPVFREYYSLLKSELSDRKMWDPPTLVELKVQADETDSALQIDTGLQT